MFASVGRHLALLNVAVVVGVIAALGLTMYLLLHQSLDAEANNSLAERIEATRLAWENGIVTGQVVSATPAGNGGEGDDDDEDHDESDDILTSGDTLLFAIDTQGQLLVNERGISLDEVPVQAGLDRALRGEVDTRTVKLHDERVRVRTEPLMRDGEVAGAIQAVRSEREHDNELELIRNVSLIGLGIGISIALPAGLFLARRAMRPIHAVFERQRAFIADASHELRTPLTVLRANADMVRRLQAPTQQQVRHEMSQMLREIDTMNRLVDDLLELARLERPQLQITTEPVDIAEVINAAVRTMRLPADKAGITLQVDAPPVFAQANSELVEQVLRILLDNAIKYSAAGDTIAVTASHHGHTLTVRVRDTGSGIDPADQPNIFDRFYRSDRARSRAQDGTGGFGLGLPIARSVVQALGGEIHLTSIPAEGTTVWFTLPAARG